MDQEKYFYEIKETSIITEEVLSFCRNDAVWENDRNMIVCAVPKEISHKQNFIRALEEQYAKVTCAVFKFEPNVCYNWHMDSIRSAAINLELYATKRLVMFGERINNDNYRILELPYKKDKFFLLNTTQPHEAINFGETRYLLSTIFEDNYISNNGKLYPFEDVKRFLQNYE
jgi:hypothetical protein